MDDDDQALRLGAAVTGIATGASPGSVAVAQGSDVLLYSLDRRERLAGWRLDEPGCGLSGAPACDPRAGTLHAAAHGGAGGHWQLLSWSVDAEEGNLARVATRTGLPKPVHSIHAAYPSARPAAGEAAAEHAASVFIVFADGTAALDSAFRNGQAQAPLGRVGRTAAAAAHDGRLAVASTAGARPGLLTLFEAKGRRLEQVASLELPRSDAPASLSLCGASAVVAWSDGDVQTLGLRAGAGAGGGVLLDALARRRLAGFEAAREAAPARRRTPKNGRKHATPPSKRKSMGGSGAPDCCVVALPRNQAAVLGWTAAGKLRVVVLDTQLGVPLSARELPAARLGGAAADSPLQLVSHAGAPVGQTLLAAGGLLSLSLEGPRPTLASQLGALSSLGGGGSGVARGALHADDVARLPPPLQTRQRPRWLPGPAATQALPQAQFSEVAIPMDTRDSDAGSPADAPGLREAAALREQLRSPAGLAGAAQAGAAAQAFAAACQLSAGERRAVWVPDTLAAQLLLRLAEHAHWDALDTVWEARPLLSLTQAPGLLPLLAGAGQHRLMARVLPAVQEVPADDLQAALHLLLGAQPGPAAVSWHAQLRAAAREAVEAADADEQSQERVAAAADAVAVVQRFSPQEAALHPLVAAPCDGALLARVLRSLSGAQALRLTRYLHTWLANLAQLDAAREGARTAAGAALPPLAGVLRWLNRLLDAHAVGLAMAPASSQLARALQEAARAGLAGLQVLGPLQGALHHMQRKQPLPARQRRGADYSIEQFDISVRT